VYLEEGSGMDVETIGEPGEELRSFEKFRARAPEVQTGPKKGPKNFQNLEL